MIKKNQQFILDRALAVLAGNAKFDQLALDIPGHSERLIEVPWAAQHMIGAKNILDIGFAMSSLDWLGLLLAKSEHEDVSLTAADIVHPERVQGRYPQNWRQQVLSVPITIGDIRICELPQNHFDLVTCISTIEHIGFDEASTDDPSSAFNRSKTAEGVAAIRSPTVNKDVLGAFRQTLRTGGQVIISVPMGRGGPVLLKDSLGLYTRQWEYEPTSWAELTGQAGFEVREQRFFTLGADDCWSEVSGPEQLHHQSSELKPHASGCAVLLLKKL